MSDTHQVPTDYFDADANDLAWSFDNFAVQGIGTDRQLRQRDAREFVEQYHYTGGMGNAGMPYGCWHTATNELVAVVVFHTPISENVRASVYGPNRVDEVTELHRLAIHPKAPKNTGSWFLSRALKSFKNDRPQYTAVLSFADTTEGHDGTVYQACSADYTGMTDESRFYRDENERLRAPRQNGEHITVEKAKERGWEPEWRQAKHRYVFWLPGPYQSKDQLRTESSLTFEEYP